MGGVYLIKLSLRFLCRTSNRFVLFCIARETIVQIFLSDDPAMNMETKAANPDYTCEYRIWCNDDYIVIVVNISYLNFPSVDSNVSLTVKHAR